MDDSPSKFEVDLLPVEQVSWRDAVRFVERLTELERAAGRLPRDWEYRLPTEAQWEYACRAGTTTRYCFGDSQQQLDDYAWFDVNSNQINHLVGEKKSNAWGIFDMHGNVWEWCRDGFQFDLPGGTDPQLPAVGPTRILRGGGCFYDAEYIHSSVRAQSSPDYTSESVGFRVALVRIHES